jgi:hypothetical protein
MGKQIPCYKIYQLNQHLNTSTHEAGGKTEPTFKNKHL